MWKRISTILINKENLNYERLANAGEWKLLLHTINGTSNSMDSIVFHALHAQRLIPNKLEKPDLRPGLCHIFRNLGQDN